MHTNPKKNLEEKKAVVQAPVQPKKNSDKSESKKGAETKPIGPTPTPPYSRTPLPKSSSSPVVNRKNNSQGSPASVKDKDHKLPISPEIQKKLKSLNNSHEGKNIQVIKNDVGGNPAKEVECIKRPSKVPLLSERQLSQVSRHNKDEKKDENANQLR